MWCEAMDNKEIFQDIAKTSGIKIMTYLLEKQKHWNE